MRYLIVDGLNFFIRSFTVNPTMDINGNHVGGMVGFMAGVNKLIRDNVPDHVIICWDGEGGSVKRRSIFKDYKAGRKPKLNREYGFENPMESFASLRDQLDRLQKYLDKMPMTSINISGVEADDVIAYVCQFILDKEDTKIIVSTDRDFYQLIDKNTCVYSPSLKKFIYSKDLLEISSTLPENYIYVKALLGDPADNIKGVAGIGKKTLEKLFPILTEQVLDVDDFFNYAEKNKDTNNKYSLVLDNRRLVISNIELMQLSSPLMNPVSAKAIRYSIKESKPRYNPTDIKLMLIKDGVQIKAMDFFSLLKEQYHKSKIRS